MPFMFRGQNLDAILEQPLLAPDSLLGRASVVCANIVGDLRDQWARHRGGTAQGAYASAKGAFAGVEGWWSTRYNDDAIIRTLYGDVAARNLLVQWSGENDAATFMERFQPARKEAFYIFTRKPSLDTMLQTSFPLTYYHRDIASVFHRHAHSLDVGIMRSRVFETAEIMLRILYGNMNGPWRAFYGTRTLGTAMLLGLMHNRLLRRLPYQTGARFEYNQSSVAYTLLTFSGIVHATWVGLASGDLQRLMPGWRNHPRPAIVFPEADWYFVWKIVGSCMGLSEQLMPSSYAESEELLQAFNDSDEILRSDATIRPILDVYGRIFEGPPGDSRWARFRRALPPKDLAVWLAAIKWAEVRRDLENPFDVFDE